MSGWRRTTLTLLGVAIAVLAPAGIAGAAEPGSTEHGVNRERLAKKAIKVVETRNGIDVQRISRCGPRKTKRGLDFSRWICQWRAAGTYAGDVPYSCAGRAVWKRKKNRWRVDRCANSKQPYAPLLDAPRPHMTFGFNDNWIFQPNQALDELASTQPQVARVGLAWSGVEATRGLGNWDGSDELYRKLLARGIRPLWVIIDAPCWAQSDPNACRNGKSESHPSPSHYDEMAQFAVTAAKRYPEAIGIEVWNEPNYPLFWGGWPEPDEYAKMLRETADAIHAQVPGMPVISGGLSPHSDSDRNAVGFSNFLDRLYELGAAQKADAIGIHPYPGVGPTEDYVGDMRVYLGKVQNVMAAHHDSQRPLWATEFGISTAGEHAFDPALQGEAIAELYETMRRVPGIEMAIVHRFVEAPNLGGREAGFGVVNPNLSPKPSYCAIFQMRELAAPGGC